MAGARSPRPDDEDLARGDDGDDAGDVSYARAGGRAMGWTCAACGTANAATAAFCSMCKQVPGRSRGAPAIDAAPSARTNATSGLELDLPTAPAAPSRSSRAAAPTFVLRPRALATGRFDHVSLAQDGPALTVRWGASIGGSVRSVLGAGIGALLVAPAALGPRSEDFFVRAVLWGLAALGVAIALAAIWRIGARITHRFDNAAAAVDVERTLFGIPLGTQRHALGDRPELTIDTRVTVGRYGSQHALHTLRLTASGASSAVAQSEDEIDLRAVLRDVSEHLAHGPR